ncbi:MAG TPA: GAK system ATP-grasp enzyme [Atribacteraceae bacterium]|nr:GAK system ATP-grasp enzyme [Atribacteraceae bacterium]
MKKVGVIGIPGGWSSEKLADVLERKTGFRFLVDMESLVFDVHRGQVLYRGEDLSSFDAMVIKKIGSHYSPDFLDRLEILRFLKERGLRIFSDPYRILRVLDRLVCTVTMRLGEIPIPPTFVTESLEEACRAVEEFGRAVLKPLYTTKARGMLVVEAGRDCAKMVERFRSAGNSVIYIQQMLDLPGRDLGIAFLGGRYLATYARVRGGDSWNTTTSSGGRYEAVDPPEEVIAVAKRAQDLFGLDYTTVDVVETGMGPLVFEVSAFGGFRGLLESHSLDAAELLVDYVLEDLDG